MAIKLVGLVVVLLLLMAAAAAISLFEAQRVSNRLVSTIEGYIPTYAALARANVRSLEQALLLRRALLNRLGPSPPAEGATDVEEALAKAKQAAEEIASARTLLDREIASAQSFGDVLGLVRLDTRLEAVQSDFDQLAQRNEAVFRALAGGKA